MERWRIDPEGIIGKRKKTTEYVRIAIKETNENIVFLKTCSFFTLGWVLRNVYSCVTATEVQIKNHFGNPQKNQWSVVRLLLHIPIFLQLLSTLFLTGFPFPECHKCNYAVCSFLNMSFFSLNMTHLRFIYACCVYRHPIVLALFVEKIYLPTEIDCVHFWKIHVGLRFMSALRMYV